ncbi:MAG: hypothetical protein BM557_09540 [Flavobacterium sp. MedPE-SWcel]|uniref:phage tail tube protein n=1 Tax=uncultured Flavobacterium sp. TaxID=165435 RepID=UPI00091F6CEA|nr:phage tail tube protein [uncultured Flavobacterium sp.]OIQ16547.1 MAG: hypothetical protein BM557_09540 [Flavobacterium sp. MedPE-SWcel]
MAFIQGKKLRLSFGGKKLWHATECSLSITTDFEELASKDTDGKNQLPGDYSWTLSTSNLVADLPDGDTTHVNADDLIDLQLNDTIVTVEFTTGVTDDTVYSGSAYVSQSDITATNGAVSSGSFSFNGDGKLTKDVVSA